MTPHMNKALGTSRAQGFVFTIVLPINDHLTRASTID